MHVVKRNLDADYVSDEMESSIVSSPTSDEDYTICMIDGTPCAAVEGPGGGRYLVMREGEYVENPGQHRLWYVREDAWGSVKIPPRQGIDADLSGLLPDGVLVRRDIRSEGPNTVFYIGRVGGEVGERTRP